MMTYKKLTAIAGWTVFAIAMVVYFLSAERTGSLWDCGEFILGAYKLQVVHPPGAPLFLIVGRMFTWVADVLSDNPSDIAFAVNLMSGMFTAFAAAFVAWTTMILSRMAFVVREIGSLTRDQEIVIALSGLAAGLATAFSTSIWFSAVEGEVYAMSTFFTAMTVWAMVKWYGLPDESKSDRWLIFAIYAGGLSIGVHLLSLLTFPAMGLLYYLKKYEQPKVLGAIVATGIGAGIIVFVQQFVIVGIPILWSQMELLMVNGMGMPFHSGLFPTLLIIAAIAVFTLRAAHKSGNGLIQRIMIAMVMVTIAFSTIGVVIIRANADTPINMNAPSDVMRVIPYLNREQYGERALLRGPHFEAQPIDIEKTPRYGQVGKRYEVVDHRISYVYDDKDKMLLPRISHNDQNRIQLHRMWMNDTNRPPDMAYNLSFMFRYQIGWMYIRYFMWNFAGRQNGEQGYYPWNPKSGHWLSGIAPLDSYRLYNQSKLPSTIKNDQARNRYFLLPLIFGLIGFLWHLQRRRKDWLGLVVAFLFTGLGIIFYTNQPPNEPRERDYVLVGSFFIFCMWIGMAIPAIYEFAKQRLATVSGNMLGILCGALVLTAPVIMGFQNFDDHSRRHHTAARDYASNFLESCDPNAIIFTYGDNDTYPLWYAQEVEGIRTDVRVVNLSLIAVDWYINGLRKRVNDSAPIKFTISEEAYRGEQRNALYPMQNTTEEMPLNRALRIMGESHPVSAGGQTFPSYLPSTNLYIPIEIPRAIQSGWVSETDTGNIVTRIPVKLGKRYITKDDLAVLDIIMSNIYDRPVYFSVTCREDKLMGLEDYTQMEGMGLKIIPIRTPSNKNMFIYGSGRMDVERTYDRVMNKWKWGNFDKKRLYVDNSYGASIQAMKMIMYRSTQELLRAGDSTRAVAITDRFFQAFPHMNFPYDARTLIHINFYMQAGAMDKAKEHLSILAPELAEWMVFFESLSAASLEAGFQSDYQLTLNAVQELLRMADQIGDDDFKQRMQALLGQYNIQTLRD